MKHGPVVKNMLIELTGLTGKIVIVRTTPGTDLPRTRTYWVQKIGWGIITLGLRIMLGGKHRWQTVTEKE